MKLAVRADKYFNGKAKIFGDMVQPVDLNAGLVVPKSDKFGTCDACGEETEDNIRERFGLEAPDCDEGGE